MKSKILAVFVIPVAAFIIRPASLAGADTSPGMALSLSFPRLGMWWPDPEVQKLSEIARYDWVVLNDWEAEYIAPLRSLHPGIILLTSANACEVGFNPGPGADFEDNEEARKVPPGWFLTQVGSTLAREVDAAETTFCVGAVTASSDAGVFSLFTAGDIVLIEGEAVLVEAVDAARKTLTVRRGYVRPASSHPAEARLAALITFWPGTWVMDLSTFCPPAVLDPAIGPERWSDYRARQDAARMATGDWDGILLDRTDPNQSWLILDSTARSIDPDRSNAAPSDYSAFDRAWNEGLRRYEARIRDLIGPEPIIFANCAMTNYDLLNGNNFEGFPDDYRAALAGGEDIARDWEKLVFGGGLSPEKGGYLSWLQRALQPNLTMIETYEDDTGPDPRENQGYHNPAAEPGFVPDYRKMRFGLATALLGDGFFSYEINTDGHGSLGLFWFDEYDRGGIGRGYLGLPLGPAEQVGPEPAGENLLGDSSFEESMGNWELWTDESYEAGAAFDSTTSGQGARSLKVEITRAGTEDWGIGLENAPVELEEGVEYTLSFQAKADREISLSSWVQRGQAPWDAYLEFSNLTLTTDWRRHRVTAFSFATDRQALFSFGLGATTGVVWLDDISLRAGSARVWRRDFRGGVALVNATTLPKTISPGGVFRRIRGSQAPEINDGRLTSTVTLPAFDGLILLRLPARTGLVPPGDYDGDGTADPAVFRPSSGLWAVRGMTRAYFGASFDLPVPADYDGDGRTEIALFRPENGLWAIREVSRFYYGSRFDLPVPADYDGDGTSDSAVFRESDGLWAVRGMTRIYLGTVGDAPRPGDYDGDGTDDPEIFRPGTGLWAGSAAPRRYFGGLGDESVPGDYDGDGAWEEGIFRAGSGLWAIRGITRRYFGGTAEAPVPADYSGSGTDSICVFRSSSGLWAASGVTRIYFGATGDLPVTR